MADTRKGRAQDPPAAPARGDAPLGRGPLGGSGPSRGAGIGITGGGGEGDAGKILEAHGGVSAGSAREDDNTTGAATMGDNASAPPEKPA
jgi:hypothetical protein